VTKGVYFKKDVVLLQPIHHRGAFTGGFLDIADRLGAENATANCHLILVYWSCQNWVDIEKLFKIRFLEWELVILKVEHFIVDE